MGKNLRKEYKVRPIDWVRDWVLVVPRREVPTRAILDGKEFHIKNLSYDQSTGRLVGFSTNLHKQVKLDETTEVPTLRYRVEDGSPTDIINQLAKCDPLFVMAVIQPPVEIPPERRLTGYERSQRNEPSPAQLMARAHLAKIREARKNREPIYTGLPDEIEYDDCESQNYFDLMDD